MYTTISSLLFFSFVMAFIIYFGMYRNNKTYQIITVLNEICGEICNSHADMIKSYESYDEFNEDHKKLVGMWDSILNDKTYDKMVWSFKSLNNPKNWLTNKQMDFLNNDPMEFLKVYRS